MPEQLPVRVQLEQKAKTRRRDAFTGSDSEDSEPEEKGRFRFNARKAFLTYSKCGIKPKEFLEVFPLASRIKTCFAKQEHHEDGSLHLHTFVSFTRKLDLTNPQCFDLVIESEERHPGDDRKEQTDRIGRFHPNIKRVGGPEDLVRAYEYLCKDGVLPTELRGKVDLYRFSKNFCNVYRDRTSWLSYRRGLAQSPPHWPIIGPNGHIFQDPATAGKKRNAWVWGPPDAGKTKWLEEKVYCYQHYTVGSNTYPFDLYTDQQIIVYDDIVPRAEHLLVLGNSSNYSRPVPGATRYHQRVIPAALCLWTVVCSNKPIESVFEEEGAETIAAIRARFVEIEIIPNPDA